MARSQTDVRVARYFGSMLERGATLRVAPGPLTGLGAQLLLLAGLGETVGLGRAGWAVGAGSAVVLDATLARALWRNAAARLGPAGWVTLTRATFTVGVAGLTAASFARDVPTGWIVALAVAALTLDLVDGQVARRTGTASALGAWLDGEVDAFLILALSVAAAPSSGYWVIAIGAMRYAFLAGMWRYPWMRVPLPRRGWRKVAAAAQGITLTIAVAGFVPAAVMRAALVAALALLAESFGRDVLWLWRRHDRASEAVARHAWHARRDLALTWMSFAILWAVLVVPPRPWLVTPRVFVRLPVEALLLVAVVVLLPAGARRFVPWVAGPALGLLLLAKALDIGFFVAFDRPFDPVDDWSFASFGVETTRDTFGATVADLVVVAAVLAATAALVLPTLAMRRVTRVTERHRRDAARGAAGLAAMWLVLWALDAHLVPGAAVASATGAAQAAGEVHAVAAGLRDHTRFRSELRKDANRSVPAAQLLTGLRGKDVLLVFVESYGRLAVEGSSFSPKVDSILDASTKQLAGAGFAARSGWLTSSTFGGGSWWAHATLQSGTWIDSQGRYEQLVKSDRLTLATAFRRAGWRTVADDPSNNRDWPEGRTFYRYDRIYDRRNVGYRGPTYGFSSMPDQYTLLGFQRLVLAPRNRRPVFSEIDTTSSHTPWTRVPPLIPWSKVGDGSVYNRLPVDRSGLTDTEAGYSTSIQYSLRTLFSFVERYGRKNLVLIVLGDHQPARVVSGRPGHDVPISILAGDPAVLKRIDGWGWTDGLRPGAAAPVWPMSAFRDRFLDAFGSNP
jgi:phosphatidylglycerophosphate synthase